MPSINPIRKTSVSDTVYRQMMEMIVSGQWEVGSKIPSENELKDQLGVSRNTVRSTISRLSALGLLESRQGDGTFVKKLDLTFYLNIFFPSMLLEERDTLKLLEFERGLQIESARLACERRTVEQLERLEVFVVKMEEYCHSDHDRYLKNDLDFHVLVCEMSFNDLYLKSMQTLRGLLYYALGQIVDRYNSNISIQYHHAIVQAIRQRDQKSVTHLMAEHMDDVINKRRAIAGMSCPGEQKKDS